MLKGLTVPQFETEMRHFVQGVGLNCGGCHTRGNFASEDNPRKAIARRMIEMTQALNQKYFAAWVPADGESTLGRVTCYTCHQGETTPKSAPAPARLALPTRRLTCAQPATRQSPRCGRR